ncbi:MAG: sensor histidine kinase, partial [Pseudomonadota bacterium]
MERWRQSILQVTLWASLALASLAYVPGVWAALQSNLGWLIIVDTVAWGSILLLALWRTLSFRIRASAFLIPWCLFALLLLWMLGPAGAGIIWLTAIPVLASLFFGYVGAVVGLAFLALTSLGYYLLLPWRTLIEYLPGQETTYDAVSWLASAGSMLFIATLVSLALAELLRRLEDTVESLGHANQRLTGIMDEREALQETILQSQKHSALGTLAAGIAHDFNNLLVPILMASEQVRDGTARDSEARRHLDTVIRSAERARQLVRRILNYSRERPASEYHPVRLEPVLREVGGLLRSSAPASIEMRYRIDAPEATVMADPEELHQILMNLGTNACLAMPEGGCLTWHLYAADEEDGVRLDVCDTGQGIAADVLPRIFDPFFTTREPGNGTGLGLSIVQRLVTAMQGHMDVESDGESGTCFR